MQPASHARLRRGIRCAIILALAFSAGCSAPSLLITPVTSRRELDETVLVREGWWAWDKIALIDVSGLLQNSPRTQFFSEGEHPVSLLLEQLDKARRDSRVKAVVLRINSPGGTVVASELMHAEITDFRRRTGKPVLAVMMDLATSGGYYVACACDEIIAQPSSVTGSIGVIMQMVDVTGTMNIVGVKTDAITSGSFKDAGSPLRPMQPHEREYFQRIVDDMFERFVQIVVKGRPNLNEAEVRALADGRIYTAGQALEAGLIDRVAGMREALQVAKDRTGSKTVQVVTYHRPLAYRPNYYAEAPSTPRGDINLLKLDLSDWLANTTPQFLYIWRPEMFP